MLAEDLKGRIDSEVRTTILGHMQRGGTPTPYDRNLSTAFGARAASLVSEGTYGVMVAMQDGDVTHVPLAEVAGKTRTVPLDSSLIASAVDVGTSFGVSDLKTELSETDDAGLS